MSLGSLSKLNIWTKWQIVQLWVMPRDRGWLKPCELPFGCVELYFVYICRGTMPSRTIWLVETLLVGHGVFIWDTGSLIDQTGRGSWLTSSLNQPVNSTGGIPGRWVKVDELELAHVDYKEKRTEEEKMLHGQISELKEELKANSEKPSTSRHKRRDPRTEDQEERQKKWSSQKASEDVKNRLGEDGCWGCSRPSPGWGGPSGFSPGTAERNRDLEAQLDKLHTGLNQLRQDLKEAATRWLKSHPEIYVKAFLKFRPKLLRCAFTGRCNVLFSRWR